MLRIISLNCWGGKIYKEMMDFISVSSETTDVFCFQEVYTSEESLTIEGKKTDLYEQLQKLLPNYSHYYAECPPPTKLGAVRAHAKFGIALFVKQGIDVVSCETFKTITDEHRAASPAMVENSIAQQATLVTQGNTYTVFNFHGIWVEGIDKKDHPLRTEQAETLAKHVSHVTGKRVIVGDFNTDPDTEAIAIIEKGMRNLVKEYGITSTRTPEYVGYDKWSRFADYAIVSPETQVHDFKVFPDVVSDHSPLKVVIS